MEVMKKFDKDTEYTLKIAKLKEEIKQEV